MKTFLQFALTETAYGSLETAKDIIKTLRTAGYQAYLVGGCVRDTLLGLHPKDYDVATDATPAHVLELFPDADKVGAHFGVVIHKHVEIATFRSDGNYGDGRRPDSVHYEKNPREDAARRDFTINAMFMDPFTGHVLDFFGGRDDIKNRVLRAVGDPHKRFHEDHLRMMRVVRFAARLGFTVDPHTLEAMSGNSHHIKNTAVERTAQELMKSLSHDPAKTMRTMDHTGLLANILPEVAELDPMKFRLTLSTLEHISKPTPELAMAGLLSQLDPGVAGQICKRLKLSNDELKHVTSVLTLQKRIGAVKDSDSLDVLKKLMREPFFSDALTLYGVRVKVHDSHAHAQANVFLTGLYSTMAHHDLHPAKLVTGDDLIAMGMKPGKKLGEILHAIEVGQLTGAIKTREQALAVVAARR